MVTDNIPAEVSQDFTVFFPDASVIPIQRKARVIA
jgi:hypothetical protein